MSWGKRAAEAVLFVLCLGVLMGALLVGALAVSAYVTDALSHVVDD